MTEIDIHLFRILHHLFSGGWIGLMAVFSAFGGGWGALMVIPLLVSTRTRRFARALAGVLAVTAVLVFTLKRLVARARPCNCLEDVKALVFTTPTDFSFPSGHSAGSFAFAVFVAIFLVRTISPNGSRLERVLRWIGAVGIVVVAIGVGLSRIALGVHFPGDVLAGAILGTTVAAIGAHLYLGQRRLRAPSDASM